MVRVQRRTPEGEREDCRERRRRSRRESACGFPQRSTSPSSFGAGVVRAGPPQPSIRNGVTSRRMPDRGRRGRSRSGLPHADLPSNRRVGPAGRSRRVGTRGPGPPGAHPHRRAPSVVPRLQPIVFGDYRSGRRNSRATHPRRLRSGRRATPHRGRQAGRGRRGSTGRATLGCSRGFAGGGLGLSVGVTFCRHGFFPPRV